MSRKRKKKKKKQKRNIPSNDGIDREFFSQSNIPDVLEEMRHLRGNGFVDQHRNFRNDSKWQQKDYFWIIVQGVLLIVLVVAVGFIIWKFLKFSLHILLFLIDIVLNRWVLFVLVPYVLRGIFYTILRSYFSFEVYIESRKIKELVTKEKLGKAELHWIVREISDLCKYFSVSFQYLMIKYTSKNPLLYQILTSEDSPTKTNIFANFIFHYYFRGMEVHIDGAYYAETKKLRGSWCRDPHSRINQKRKDVKKTSHFDESPSPEMEFFDEESYIREHQEILERNEIEKFERKKLNKSKQSEDAKTTITPKKGSGGVEYEEDEGEEEEEEVEEEGEMIEDCHSSEDHEIVSFIIRQAREEMDEQRKLGLEVYTLDDLIRNRFSLRFSENTDESISKKEEEEEEEVDSEQQVEEEDRKLIESDIEEEKFEEVGIEVEEEPSHIIIQNNNDNSSDVEGKEEEEEEYGGYLPLDYYFQNHIIEEEEEYENDKQQQQLLLLPPEEEEKVRVEDYLEQGKFLEENGFDLDAIGVYKQYLEIYPSDVKIRERIIHIYEKKKILPLERYGKNDNYVEEDPKMIKCLFDLVSHYYLLLLEYSGGEKDQKQEDVDEKNTLMMNQVSCCSFLLKFELYSKHFCVGCVCDINLGIQRNSSESSFVDEKEEEEKEEKGEELIKVENKRKRKKKKKKKGKLSKCSKCKYVRYCSRECQLKNWREHKNICSKLIFLKEVLQPKEKSPRKKKK